MSDENGRRSKLLEKEIKKPDKEWGWKKCFVVSFGLMLISWGALPIVAAMLHKLKGKRPLPKDKDYAKEDD